MAEGVAGTDGDLVLAARGGDDDAFGELYRRHAGAVRLAVGDHVDDPETRADLVQEAFVRALANIDALQDPDKFRPWVLQIGRNIGIDYRRANRRPVISIDDEDRPETPCPEPGPAELSELSAMASRLETGLARLSPRDATVLSLSVQLGFGPAEIAAALGITRNHAKVVLHRARKRLRMAVEIDAETQGFGLGDLVALDAEAVGADRVS